MCCLLLAVDKLRPFVGNARAVTGGEGISENSLEMKQRYFPNKMCSLLKTFSLPTDAHNVEKHRAIKTF